MVAWRQRVSFLQGCTNSHKWWCGCWERGTLIHRWTINKWNNLRNLSGSWHKKGDWEAMKIKLVSSISPRSLLWFLPPGSLPWHSDLMSLCAGHLTSVVTGTLSSSMLLSMVFLTAIGSKLTRNRKIQTNTITLQSKVQPVPHHDSYFYWFKWWLDELAVLQRCHSSFSHLKYLTRAFKLPFQ